MSRIHGNKRLAALILVASLSGCAANLAHDPGVDASTWPDSLAKNVDPRRVPDPLKDFSGVVVAAHPEGPEAHAIRSLHPEEAFGMEVVAYSPLVDPRDPFATDTWFSSLDAWDDGQQYLVAVTRLGGSGGATIVDVTDPTKPTVLSQIKSGMVNSDVQFTDDGKYLFLGAIIGPRYYAGSQTSAALAAREAVARSAAPWLADTAGSGISVWNLTEKRNPKFMVYKEYGEFHNLFTVTIDGTYYLAQAWTSNIYRFDPAGAGSLELISNTADLVHDMTVKRHPITGDWLLYTGKGRGTAVFDFQDPAMPIEIGEWGPQLGPHDAKGWHEQEAMADLVEGRALVVVAGESLAGSEPYGILDVTDPTSPEFLGQWEVPGHPRSQAQSETFYSPHELDTWNGYFVSGNYHAGVWLVDVGTLERAREPVTLGYFFGNREPAMEGAPQNPPAPFAPNHWGAYFDSRGYILTADWASGLYILGFEKTGTLVP